MRRSVSVLAAGVLAFGVCGASLVKADRPVRAGKSTVTFRAASSTPTPGFEQMTLEDGSATYVAPRVTFTADEIVSAYLGESRDIDLALTSEAAERLDRVQADRLAVFMNGRLATTAKIDAINADGGVTITDLSDTARARLARSLGAVGQFGAMIRVVPQQAAAKPGDVVTVDVYVTGSPEVRTYQVALDAVGGRTGTLTRQVGRIDQQRSDFVHAGGRPLVAVDDSRGRFGGTTLDGNAANASSPRYLGSFDYAVSKDASGTFVVKLRMGDDTFLMNAKNEYLAFAPANATIKIGGGARSTR